MNLQGIISIAGRPGLFKIVAQGKQTVIVESMIDRKRFAAHASDKISTLEDISVYTSGEDMKLTEVYSKMYEKLQGKEALSHKEDTVKLREFVLTFLPDYDSDRVYDSDVKKLFQWYNTLLAEGLLTPEVKETKKENGISDKKIKTSKTVLENKPTKSVKQMSTAKSSVKSASGAKKVAAVKTGGSRGK
ncbi:MAG: DUF5606 domain-containing protein [Bacteroidota bacterium]